MRLPRFWTEDPGTGTGSDESGAGATGDPPRDAAYWQEQAKLAFKARDDAKRKARDLEQRTLPDDRLKRLEELEAKEAQAEEERKRKAGEFESLRQDMQAKHAKALDAERARVDLLSTRWRDTVIKAEFGAASDWFGGDSAKTILDVELGMAALSKYVTVEDTEDDPRGHRVIVKHPRGHPIVGEDGNPAPFAVAIGELIAALPNKDRILRGSGKTGSGSSGGATTVRPDDDWKTLIAKAQAGDKHALKALQDRQQRAGQTIVGPAFNRSVS